MRSSRPSIDLTGSPSPRGRDIEPSRYGQDAHPLLAATEPQRDAFELALVRAALARDLPILGMCRGIQVLNVALSGTLAQDVSLLTEEHPSDPGWRQWKTVEASSLAEADLPPHPRRRIDVAPESLLGRALEHDLDRGQFVPPSGRGATR